MSGNGLKSLAFALLCKETEIDTIIEEMIYASFFVALSFLL